MYRQLANYYDEIYHFKNYQKEAGKIDALIQRHKKSSGNRLLDVACGTGNHIEYLKQHFSGGVVLQPCDAANSAHEKPSAGLSPRGHDKVQTESPLRHLYLVMLRHMRPHDKRSGMKRT